ncbi:MAG TPA: rifamycin-inactivating phosphotransferase, partial [Rhodanobacteraceae bacterium]|nr:rifamycin-inactivating phosphotransferase [Rhodanobacteraceae bacterium]
MPETNDRRAEKKQTSRYVVNLDALDRTDVAIAGGKGANLGELARIDDARVPSGFVVTTDAFLCVLAETSIDDRLDALARLAPDDHDAIRMLTAEIRRAIERVAIAEEIASAIRSALAGLGDRDAYAVRSSATAEDLPTASFAGQQDTYLNVTGTAAILAHVSRCWASLFTERAATYRLRNDVDHRNVRMAVVVQRMIFPQASGVLFTADPVTGHRKIMSIEAGFGLGEAQVSGLANADVYKVRDGGIVAKTIAAKPCAIEASPAGGTRERTIAPAEQQQPALADAQILRLAALGRRIEAHFGCPQDIEWCFADGEFAIVQSRPITTLYPIPPAADRENRVYVSTGHQQMMTDAMTPLGISVRQLNAAAPMFEAGGRLFVDVTRYLASAEGRATRLAMLAKSDPLIGDALDTVVERGFVAPQPDVPTAPPRTAPPPIGTDPLIVAGLVEQGESSNAALKREIATKSGSALFDFIRTDIEELKRILFDPRSIQAIMASVDAASWLNEHVEAWLGEKNAADVLAQSVPNNVTSEMGLALLQVADAIRPHPAVVAFLERADREDFLDELQRLDGGAQAKAAIGAWLDKYGMRCVGEIDIGRPRWSERPTTLVPLILGNVRNFERGEGERRFAQGLKAASDKEHEVLQRLRALPDGDRKADEAKAMIDRLRTFAGYREYPKYFNVGRYFAYKQALMEEARRLARAGVLDDPEEIFFLTLDELHDVVRTRQADHRLIRERKAA